MKVEHFIPFFRRSSGITPVILSSLQSVKHRDIEVNLNASYIEEGIHDFEVNQTLKETYLARVYGISKSVIPSCTNETRVIHVHGLWSFVNLVMLLFQRRVKNDFVIISVHGMLSSAALRKSRILKRLFWILIQRKQLNKANLIHVTSLEEGHQLIAKGVYTPYVLIPLGLSHIPLYEEQTNSEPPIVFGFLGRIVPIKRLEILVEAFKKVNETENVELWIAGPINDKEYFKVLGLEFIKGVKYFGELHGQNKTSFYKGIDCFVLPSSSENFGMVVLEAMSYQNLVIASKGTPWELLQEYGIGWFGFDDSYELVSLMKLFLHEDPKKIMDMRRRAYDIVSKEYSIQNFESALYKAYKNGLTTLK